MHSNNHDRRVYYKIPNGRTIVGTTNVLHYMKKNNYSDEEINIVKQNLQEDGWSVEDFLPEGRYNPGYYSLFFIKLVWQILCDLWQLIVAVRRS